MWGLYHQMRTSEKFRKAWSDFLRQSISTVSTPFFYLHVTDFIFKALIRIDFPVPVAINSESKQDSVASLTTLEQNALRYVAGYVCRKIRDRVDARNSPLKCDIRIAMIELAGDEIDEEAATEEWTNKIDRGGLWHINDDVFNLFVAIEFEAKRLLLAIKKDESSLNLKKKLHNEDYMILD